MVVWYSLVLFYLSHNSNVESVIFAVNMLFEEMVLVISSNRLVLACFF